MKDEKVDSSAVCDTVKEIIIKKITLKITKRKRSNKENKLWLKYFRSSNFKFYLCYYYDGIKEKQNVERFKSFEFISLTDMVIIKTTVFVIRNLVWFYWEEGERIGGVGGGEEEEASIWKLIK